MMLQVYYKAVAWVLLEFYIWVTVVLHKCYRADTGVSHDCHTGMSSCLLNICQDMYTGCFSSLYHNTFPLLFWYLQGKIIPFLLLFLTLCNHMFLFPLS